MIYKLYFCSQCISYIFLASLHLMPNIATIPTRVIHSHWKELVRLMSELMVIISLFIILTPCVSDIYVSLSFVVDFDGFFGFKVFILNLK